MWRQMQVDRAYADRVRRALLGALVRANALSFGVLVLLAAGTAALAAADGDWSLPLIAGASLIVIPSLLWRAASRATLRTPAGSFVAYAVTPDGTYHASSAAGTTTVNPGYVDRVAATRDCWLISLASGTLAVVPRELIPDADAQLLVRHLPTRLVPPPASRPAIQ